MATINDARKAIKKIEGATLHYVSRECAIMCKVGEKWPNGYPENVTEHVCPGESMAKFWDSVIDMIKHLAGE